MLFRLLASKGRYHFSTSMENELFYERGDRLKKQVYMDELTEGTTSGHGVGMTEAEVQSTQIVFCFVSYFNKFMFEHYCFK